MCESVRMAESCVAEPLPPLEDAEQLVADEYFNNRQASDSVHGDDSSSSGSEDSGDISLARDQLKNHSWTHVRWT